MVPDPLFTSTYAVTIDAPPERVWPWIAQMGSGRAGWYSWDAIDNGGMPSATCILTHLQTVVAGDIMPAVPGAILAYGSLGFLWPFAAMHQREVLAAGGATWSDTLHVVLGGVTVLLMFLALGVGAAAFGRRFRLYSIASGVVLLAFGVLTFVEAPHLQANLSTPWIGLWERINISVFLLWIAVLATVLRRPEHRIRATVSPSSDAPQRLS